MISVLASPRVAIVVLLVVVALVVVALGSWILVAWAIAMFLFGWLGWPRIGVASRPGAGVGEGRGGQFGRPRLGNGSQLTVSAWAK